MKKKSQIFWCKTSQYAKKALKIVSKIDYVLNIVAAFAVGFYLLSLYITEKRISKKAER